MRITDEQRAMAGCLSNGPIADVAADLVSMANETPGTPIGVAARAWIVAQTFADMEASFASGLDPVGPIRTSLERSSQFLSGLPSVGERSVNGESPSVEAETGEHYGRLFEQFSDASYFDETIRLLQVRLERNGVRISGRALDVGCGGGRYTVALAKSGASEAVGVDMSELGIADARRRVDAAGIDGVSFEIGNVLDLGFETSSFDTVFSNGVLHHSKDWVAGVGELVRVLRPGGTGWLYLIEEPGGLFWDLIEVLRVVMAGHPKDVARQALTLAGIPANRIFYMLDHVMVPINLRLTSSEIEHALVDAGATDVRRLQRGTDFDRVEAIHRGDPFAETCYGVGENRFVFTKAS